MYRGKFICQDRVILADFPWPMARHFRRAPSSRATSTLGDIMKFQKDETILRPNLLSAWEASEEWVRAQSEDDALFLEYVTAAEENEDGEEVPDQGPAMEAGATGRLMQEENVEVIKQLQARIEELETRQSTAVRATPKKAPGPSRDLFNWNFVGGNLGKTSSSSWPFASPIGKVRDWHTCSW